MRIPEVSAIWPFGTLGIWVFGYLGIWVFGCFGGLVVWWFGGFAFVRLCVCAFGVQ